MGGACVAEQLILGEGSTDPRRRLNLVNAEAPAGPCAEALADYVWSLAPGDPCFACDSGTLQALTAARTVQSHGAISLGLVCEVCGAEVSSSEAA